MGHEHCSVNHGNGEFVRPRAGSRLTRAVASSGAVHTNTMHGHWGSFVNRMRGLKPLRREHQLAFFAEFMWRHNTRVLKPGSSLLEEILSLLSSIAVHKDVLENAVGQ